MTAAETAFIEIAMQLEMGVGLSWEERLIAWREGDKPFSWEVETDD